jgi:hypothetical protein
MLADRGQHDHLDVRLADCEIERCIDVIGHLHVLGISLVRPVQRDAGDGRARLVVKHRLEGREFRGRFRF